MYFAIIMFVFLLPGGEMTNHVERTNPRWETVKECVVIAGSVAAQVVAEMDGNVVGYAISCQRDDEVRTTQP